MTDVFTAPDDGGDLKSSDFSTSMADRLGAQWADTLDPKDSLSGMWLARQAAQGIAGGSFAHDYDIGVDADTAMRLDAIDQQAKAAIPNISREDAREMLKQEGLSETDVHLGDAPSHKLPVLKMQIAEAHTRRDREAAIERGPQGFFPDALGLVTSIGVGMIDPVNAAAFSIPVLGEARMGKILASAGDSILARGAARFGQGTAQGAIGTAALQPADWWLKTRDGQDYTMAQAMESIVMGAGMGGAFHAGFGAVGDIRNRVRGLPLAGSPTDLLLRGLMTGTHVHADQLAEEGVPLEEVPGVAEAVPEPEVSAGELPIHPADILADLPAAAREDAIHAAMADVIADRPTQAAEMLQIAADHDPRIAASFEAFHGSPHDFDRFDISKIGTGDGAQSYGHGLYFAENEKVARGYQRATSDKAFVDKIAELYDEGFSPGDAWDEIKDHWSDFMPAEQRLMTALEKDDWLGFDYPHQAVSAALRDIKSFDVSPETAAAARAMGNMYRVKISANPEHFLDWDKPLSEQSEYVRKALLEHSDATIAGTAEKWGHDVSALYSRLSQRLVQHDDESGESWGAQGPSIASKALRDAGIRGIRYLDQGSRTPSIRLEDEIPRWQRAVAKAKNDLDAALKRGDSARDIAGHEAELARAREGLARAEGHREELTRNFVVFNDKDIEITHKNGEPVRKMDLVAEHQMARAKAKGLRGRAAADPRTWSLFEYLASKGGLKPDPELRAIFGNERGPFVPSFGPLLRKAGMTLDHALRSAKDGHYMFDAADVTGNEARLTPRDLLDLIDQENRKHKVYRNDFLAPDNGVDFEQEAKHIRDALHTEIAAATGEAGVHIDPELEARVVEIVQKEGVHDVMEAYERAIMEDGERYDAAAEARAADQQDHAIPGWDVPDDAGAASAGGGASKALGGQAGSAEPGAVGSLGEQPRAARPSDRAAAQAKLKSPHAVVAADPRWRELADTTPDYNDPEVLTESEEAARTPEPASVDPAKSLSALEKAAADAEEVWRQLEPTLTEDERKAVNEAFANLQIDKDTKDRMIADGVTCLMGAIG